MRPKELSSQISDYVYAGAAARLIDDSKCLMKTAVGNNRERGTERKRERVRMRTNERGSGKEKEREKAKRHLKAP